MMTAKKHDDRKGHHYYTPASQADACVYSSDDPCGHHASQKVIMLRKMSSCFAKCHHASQKVIMLRKRSSCFAKGHHASQKVIMLRKIMNGTSLACVGGNLPPLLISIGQCDFSHGDRCIVTKHLYDVVCPYRGNQLNLIR